MVVYFQEAEWQLHVQLSVMNGLPMHCMHAYMHIYICTYMHTCIDVYIYKSYIHTSIT